MTTKLCKVLIVDDEEDLASTLAERLSLRGFSVETAYNGKLAFQAIEKFAPNLILLDLMMPGIHGTELFRQIKASHPQIAIILLTGHGSLIDDIQGTNQGAFDYLMKPVKIEELVEKMQEVLEACRPTAQ